MAATISENKLATNTLLQSHGIPIPEFMFCADLHQDATSFLEKHKPLVIKPFDTNKGVEIHMNIANLKELEHAFLNVRKVSSHAILQRQAAGRDYRILLIGDELAGVLLNEWAYVTGNGKDKLEQLIEIENDKRETEGTAVYDRNFKMLSPVPLEDVARALALQGLNFQYIPGEAEKIYISYCGNGWAGALAIDKTENIHPDNLLLAKKIAAVSAIDVIGIDIRCEDIAISYKESAFAVIEVNIRPSMVDHEYPTEGKPRRVVSQYLDYLFKQVHHE
ncbi:hypothetical protein G6M26_08600 [Agrobacterium tumefaciens]|nr:hypothetical protein [Agrobacterium tumefaciens]NTE18578.1 hypothetical protein [Agrobacterium tumefaciens]